MRGGAADDDKTTIDEHDHIDRAAGCDATKIREVSARETLFSKTALLGVRYVLAMATCRNEKQKKKVTIILDALVL